MREIIWGSVCLVCGGGKKLDGGGEGSGELFGLN